MAHKFYGTFAKNIGAFIKGLPESSVRFLYFGNDMTTPLIKDTFKEWKPKGVALCYILGGSSVNYCYVYQKTRLVGLLQGKTNVYHGNHITFGFIAGRNDAIYIKTHVTTYAEDVFIVAQYTKSRSECNFTYHPAHMLSPTLFSTSTQCENIKFANVKLGAFYETYPISNANIIIYLLCCVLQGIISGGQKRSIKQAPLCKRRGRKCIKGGAIAAYKGITFMTDTFVEFLSTHMLQAVKRARQDLLSASVLFDDLHHNNTIVILYDFDDDTRNIFYIDSVMALTACYASNARAPVAAETLCLEQFMAMAASISTRVTAVTV